ncbi:hypothetical protein F5Y18DRAFT_378617 [Xylariaceae sp. FL1019]|nr:hypothetical protein F5Y18DRAFT_378617 [Xylariaceae sp. FL1019]
MLPINPLRCYSARICSSRILPLSSQTRNFSTTRLARMPEKLTKSEVTSETDPSVAKQYDNETPLHQQFTEFYDLQKDVKIVLLTTLRPNIGPVSRAMAVAKRVGPDFLFLSNTHSKKFSDISADKTVEVAFQNSGGNQDWASVTGEAVVARNDDPRIKELWNKGIKAWFGDLGDGVHDGGPDDPRMALIEVKSKYIRYWKSTVGAVGFLKETTVASLTGQVAQTGVLRELNPEDIEKARTLG